MASSAFNAQSGFHVACNRRLTGPSIRKRSYLRKQGCPNLLAREAFSRPSGTIRSGCWATAAPAVDGSQQTKSNDATVQSEKAEDKAAFTWLKHWYPVGVVRDLDVSRPTPLKIFGKSLVLWRDGEKQWKCFADTCPHRLAPLSEGRIDGDGNLQCAYHGWSFSSDGACNHVSQTHNLQHHDRAASHPRACATTYPTQVQQELVWVWPEAGADAHLEAMSQPAPLIPLLTQDRAIHVSPWFMRDLPYGHDVLFENLLDPAHVPWAHHGVQGDRFKAPIGAMGKPQALEHSQGFSIPWTQDINKSNPEGSDMQRLSDSKDVDLGFQAPNLVHYKYQGSIGLQIILYSTPTTPGNTRLHFTVLADKQTAPKSFAAFLRIKNALPWLWFVDHYERNMVLDGDNCFLHMQDCKRHTEERNSSYYMPTSMDAAVAAFHTWMSRTAGPLPFAVPDTAETWTRNISRHELLDRYTQHTQHCRNCSQALQVFTWMQRAALGCAAIAALSSAAAVGAGEDSLAVWGRIAAAAALSGFAAWRIQIERRKFLFMDYVHADR